MNKFTTSIALVLSSLVIAVAQPCPGDIYVLEGENVEVWKVQVEGTQVLSLGAFQGSVNVGGSDFVQDDSEGWWGLYVVSHDLASGTFNWVQQIVGAGFYVTNPVMTTNGTTVLVSVTEGGGDGSIQAMRIEAFDLITGVPSWSKNYPLTNTGSNLPFAAQVAPYDGGADAAANYYITGAFAGDLDLSVATLSTGGSLSETFVFSLDENGNELWAVQSTGTNGRGRAWTLEMTPADEILIGGHFTGTVDFGGTSFAAVDNTITNPYLAKLNSADGSPNWVVGMDGATPSSFNNVYDITLDDNGAVIFAGNFNDGIDILGNTLTSEGGSDAMFGSLSPSGALLWARQFGGLSTSGEFATTVNFAPNFAQIYVGVQLSTDSVYYNNAGLGLPPTEGHYVLGLDPLSGSFGPTIVDVISDENTFGYSADYDSDGDKLVMSSTSMGSGVNVKIAEMANRPRPLIDITLESGTLDPTETLSAFDPGGGVYTYQWFENGGAVGATASHLATRNAEYYVQVSGPGGCAVESERFFILDGSTLQSDSLVLVELYNRTDGANWNDNTNWLSGPVNTWNGVTVNGGRVTELYLAGNNLNGDFPASFGNLSQLEQMYFDNNNLTGTIPSTFWDIITVRHINLHDNPSLTWSIESGIQNMTSLTGIVAFSSGLTGILPDEIGSAISLQTLSIGDNNLSGTIPTSIGGLDNLIELALNNNQMTGLIPVGIEFMTGLQSLYLHDNQFTGAVPSEIGNLSLLEIDLSSNQFSGDFPDDIWQIASLEALSLGGNSALNVVLPSNLAALTQMRVISMWSTVPLKTPFPVGVYSLVNLEVLDFGGHRMTGTLDAAIGNMTNLDQLWIWNNELEGDFPVEILSTGLQYMSINGNDFTSFPDVSSLGMQHLELSFNLLGFNDVIPNLGIPNYSYSPQGRRTQVNDIVDEGGDLTLVNDYTEASNVYNWVFNQGDTISNNVDLNITGATLDNLGGYFCNISNPGVPDLTIATQFYNIAFSGDPQSFSVDNSPNSIADFKSFYAATYGTNDGDTIYVAGSAIPYDVGFSVYYTPRVIYGPGYFLAENPETQASSETAIIDGGIGFRVGSEGSEVYGLDINILNLNSQNSFIDDTLRDVHITGNRIRNYLSIDDDNQDILIDKNYINILSFTSTTAIGSSRSYQDIFINNNIIDTVASFFAQATAARNDMVNVNFDRNTINVFLDSIQDATVSNNVINSYEATNNTVNGTVSFAGASLVNGSGTLTVDNDFISTTSVDAGAFSGSDPYALSGIARIPHIYGLTDVGRIRLDTQIKNETVDDITKLSYVLGENGTIVEEGDVKSLEAGNQIDLLFRPRLGAVTPGATVDMMLWAEDSRGVKSVPQKLSFTAETTTVTGNVISSSGSAVDNGELLLFEINQEGTAFDTLATALNSQGQFTLSNIVIGDYLALANGDQAAFPDDLPTYFENIDLWEEADTILLDNTNASFDITLIARPKETTGEGVVTGIIEEEFDDETGGRIEGKRRVGGGGISARRIRRSGRGEEDTYELVAQVFSDENGEFEITGLPDDEYRINIQYPGFPMDTTSNIDFEIGGDGSDGYDLVALVDDGKISVTLVSVTGLLEELVSSISVYPNPTSDNFIYIAFKDKENLDDGLVVGLYNMVGALIIEKEIEKNEINGQRVFELPISSLRKGSYIMTIKSGNEVVGDAKIILN